MAGHGEASSPTMRAARVLNRGGMSTGFEAGGSRTATTAVEKVTPNPSPAPREFASSRKT